MYIGESMAQLQVCLKGGCHVASSASQVLPSQRPRLPPQPVHDYQLHTDRQYLLTDRAHTVTSAYKITRHVI